MFPLSYYVIGIAFLLLPFVHLNKSITVKPFKNPIRIGGEETVRLSLSQYFLGHNLKYFPSNSSIKISPEWMTHELCTELSHLFKKEILSVIKVYEKNKTPHTSSIAFIVTSANKLYKLSYDHFGEAVCFVCDSEVKGPYFSLEQVGEDYVHVVNNKNSLTVYVIPATSPWCKPMDKPYRVGMVPEMAVPLDKTKLLMVRNQKLEIVEFSPKERYLYVNLPPYSNKILKILVVYPLVITLEEYTNEIRILTYDPLYEDMFAISNFTIPESTPIQQIYLSFHERNILVAVSKDSDKVYMYNIENEYIPRLIKIYCDPDYIIPTNLENSSRIAMSSEYIGVLAGNRTRLILRVIHKLRGTKNYIASDIELGKTSTSPSIAVMDYHANIFMVSYDKTNRLLQFTDSTIDLIGRELSTSNNTVTYIPGVVTAKGKYDIKSSEIKIEVHPKKLVLEPIVVEHKQSPPQWIGYKEQWVDIDIRKYFIGSAMDVIEIKSDDNITVDIGKKLALHDQAPFEPEWCFADAIGYDGDVILGKIIKNMDIFFIQYWRMNELGLFPIGKILSISFKNPFDVFDVAFSDNLRKVFVQLKFEVKNKEIYLLYYARPDHQTMYFVTQEESSGTTEDYKTQCESVNLQYAESASYLFSGVNCNISNTYFINITRYELNPNSLTTVVEKIYFEKYRRYLINFYAGSDLYAACITSDDKESRTGAVLSFYQPYFHNRFSVHDYNLSEWKYMGSLFSKKRIVIFLASDAYIIREFTLSTGSFTVSQRNITLPKDLSYLNDNEGKIIGDIEENYVGFVATNPSHSTFYIFIYNLEEYEHNSLYTVSEANILASEVPVKLDVLPTSSSAQFYTLLYTNATVYRYSLSRNYNLRARIDDRSSLTTSAKTFQVFMNRTVEEESIINFTVTMRQISRPPIMNVSSSIPPISTFDKFKLSDYINGYDLYVNLLRSIPGATLAYREYVLYENTVHRTFHLFTTDEVEFVLPFPQGNMLYVSDLNNIHTYDPGRDEPQLQVLSDLSDVRVSYLQPLGILNACYRIAIYNSMTNTKEKLTPAQIPQVRLGLKCNNKNLDYDQESLKFDSGTTQYCTVDYVFYDTPTNVVYVLLKPNIVYHHRSASHYIAVYIYNEEDKSYTPVETLTENYFSAYVDHLRITAATFVENTVVMALEGYGLLTLKYVVEKNRPNFLIAPLPILVNDTRFASDGKIVTFATRASTLYVLYSTAGFLYARIAEGRAERFYSVPIVEVNSNLTNLYADENMVLVSGNSADGELIHCFFWVNDKLIPQWRFMIAEYCKTTIQNVWAETMQPRAFQQSPSFRMYLYCNKSIYTLDVQKEPEVRFQEEKIPTRNFTIELLVTSPVRMDFEIVTLHGYNDIEGNTYWAWILFPIIGLLIVTVVVVLLCKKKKQKEEEKGLERNFLFADYAELKDSRDKLKSSKSRSLSN